MSTVKETLNDKTDTFQFEKKGEELIKILSGHIFFQTLFAGVEHNLFTKLYKRPLSQAEIMFELNIKEQPCKILLLGLVSLNLLVKEGDKYANSETADIYLCDQSPANIKQIVRFEHYIVYKAMYHFFESTKENSNVGLCEFEGNEATLYARLTRDPKLVTIFQDAMAEISKLANHDMTQAIDLQGVSYLVDVGGGNGSNIIALTKRFPNLKAAVFDLPTVCDVATKKLQAHENHARLSAIPGNIFENELPKGPDAVMFCHFFTIWSKEKNIEILKKAHAALPKGGRAIIFNMMQNNQRNGPLTAAMGSPYFLTLATGEGMLYTWDEYIEMFKLAGFENVQIQELPNNHGIITGYKK